MVHWRIIPFDAKYAPETVRMWRESKQAAIQVEEPEPFTQQLFFLVHKLPRIGTIQLALAGEKVIGMVAYNRIELLHLYVHVDHQRQGIGKALLEKAKQEAKRKLILYTFEKSESAQQFYQSQGFHLIARGLYTDEHYPDMKYEWVARKK